MEEYLKPELKVIKFRLNDVISASGGSDCEHYHPGPNCPIEGPGECMLGDD